MSSSAARQTGKPSRLPLAVEQSYTEPAPRARPVGHLKVTVDDGDFLREETLVPAESIFERNVRQTLQSNMQTIKGKCLEARLPVLKQSLYKKDFTPHPLERNKLDVAERPWDGFKSDARMPINSLHREDFTVKARLAGEPQIYKSGDGLGHLKAPSLKQSSYTVGILKTDPIRPSM